MPGERIDNTPVDAAKARRWGLDWPRGHPSTSSTKRPLMTTNLHPDALVRIRQIVGDPSRGIPALIPISRTAFYAAVQAGKIPRPTKLGARTALWRLADVLAIANQK